MQNLQDIKKIFTKEHIEFFKNNKNEITFELLESLRSHGNEGKKIALEILDLSKDSEGYYLDAFENRISFNGDRGLKKIYTKLTLHQIHLDELERCSKNIHYYMHNYVKIVTKSGVNFPELREYQTDFIEKILPDENTDLAVIAPRQSAKSTSVGIYLSHCSLFKSDINIGICANKGSMAREFLHKTKKMYYELPIWMQVGTNTWNKGGVEFENGVRILTDVPSSNAFRGHTIHISVVDECAFIRPNAWDEFIDALMPAQGALAWKKNIILSTANGMNHFYKLVEGARKETNGYKLHEVDWRNVPRYNSDGTLKDNDAFREEIISKWGILYWEQNYNCQFVGSSHTLIPAESLKKLEAKEVLTTVTPGLKIYEKPIKGHQYILSVDPSKDGADAFAVQIVDITNFKFKQVASAQLQIDYLLMPEFLEEWGIWYNYAFIIIENNEGAGSSVADSLYKVYEYENMFFDVKLDSNSTNNTKSRKKYPGFRTTTKTRKLILNTLKMFIENDNLEVNDKVTINEFFTFILKNGKFQADDSCHDDAIMSLALVFAPFCSMKNFQDMKLLVDRLYNRLPNGEESVDVSEVFAVGSFDDGTQGYHEQSSGFNSDEYYNNITSPFG